MASSPTGPRPGDDTPWVDRCDDSARSWADEAVRRVVADANRSADTHLHVFPLPPEWGIDLYLKDESVHPTGSLKHRLARSLFLYGLANGWIREGTTIVEASSGSTAVSEAYFAQLVGLDFITVIPRRTSPEKIALIERYGGRCHFVDAPPAMYAEAERLAAETGGHYMDQFTYAERATDWRGNNNIAESIFEQLAMERHPCPEWIVVGAGTGGTSATIGRYLRYRRLGTRLAVVDPENSAFFPGWVTGASDYATGMPSRIEGIGRPRMEPSFVPSVIDLMMPVPDAASIAAMRHLHDRTGLSAGGSTGTNLWGVWHLVARMLREGRRGSVVTLICDGGERYQHSYYNDAWVAERGLDPAPYRATIDRFLAEGVWEPPQTP
ncbi:MULTISPECIES: PLP-dependent cysteine synthase family protein [Nocardiopsis]|jgi:cysteine synthase A|uniref:L-cysteine desulfhydrase Cds1 n=1 Tax=Nocardiopsis dassonvillei (strain ATCC 23218 / DSM 43111 / CIP 107115 / JCM 7437 / KCTC 9190 / NBRC 14626 / NCTC 10488 / NRRL B-5397 / IMRU 509) TaxID=446468 RepID=D7B322_NOCDD|nr:MULTISPECIES: PLP-dependent cysteine synthase family protein [Nocardiopsis]ADH68712.1 Pyridoxal-5'-phosphate-dependent protein beta subunit [Nocardiopsis dassonvillei subsp. dassonvillei DSM 43111]APC36773.1 cysteine synthase [Nocardiopsis dassonvillei]NKY81244.1 PLP-dependent cysteine synthase family protein [Nocardiopsis dassonvillei]VEI89221.1 Cysteine synthase [Nocardiopsis dassonvillei]